MTTATTMPTSQSATGQSTTAQSTTAQLLADLLSATDSVRRKDWLAAGLSGTGGGLDSLGSTSSPLSALAGAGLGWLTQFVSFMEEPLAQLRGNPGSVSSSAQGFHGAGQDVASLARSYRQSTGEETTSWSGGAASNYRDAGTQHAEGVAALGQASTMVASAMSGAGEVVAQVVEIVTQLVTEAVGKIIPIMTQAVAAAPATFGQSIAAAIPQCVQIAVEYGQKILGKLAALLSSGQNLLRLVKGALAVLEMVKQTLTQISQQSTQGDGTQQPDGVANQQPAHKPVDAPPCTTSPTSPNGYAPPDTGPSASGPQTVGFGSGVRMHGSSAPLDDVPPDSMPPRVAHQWIDSGLSPRSGRLAGRVERPRLPRNV